MRDLKLSEHEEIIAAEVVYPEDIAVRFCGRAAGYNRAAGGAKQQLLIVVE